MIMLRSRRPEQEFVSTYTVIKDGKDGRLSSKSTFGRAEHRGHSDGGVTRDAGSLGQVAG